MSTFSEETIFDIAARPLADDTVPGIAAVSALRNFALDYPPVCSIFRTISIGNQLPDSPFSRLAGEMHKRPNGGHTKTPDEGKLPSRVVLKSTTAALLRNSGLSDLHADRTVYDDYATQFDISSSREGNSRFDNVYITTVDGEEQGTQVEVAIPRQRLPLKLDVEAGMLKNGMKRFFESYGHSFDPTCDNETFTNTELTNVWMIPYLSDQMLQQLSYDDLFARSGGVDYDQRTLYGSEAISFQIPGVKTPDTLPRSVDLTTEVRRARSGLTATRSSVVLSFVRPFNPSLLTTCQIGMSAIVTENKTSVTTLAKGGFLLPDDTIVFGSNILPHKATRDTTRKAMARAAGVPKANNTEHVVDVIERIVAQLVV